MKHGLHKRSSSSLMVFLIMIPDKIKNRQEIFLYVFLSFSFFIHGKNNTKLPSSKGNDNVDDNDENDDDQADMTLSHFFFLYREL